MRYYGLALACLIPSIIQAQESAQDGVRPRAVAVQSTMLQEVGPWGAAALPEGLAPLTSDLWRNSDPQSLALLFAKISPDQRFPTLQNLTRQAIFSGGAAPSADPDIARARFEAANRFGPAEAAARLIFAVPRLASDTGLATIAIDAGLRVGRINEACSLIEAVAVPPQGTNWLEARAACYALNEEPAAANLSVDLAKSRGLTDTWLSRAVAAVAGPLTAPPPFRVDSGRAVALSLRAKLKPPVTLVTNQDPMALSALANATDFMTGLAPEERLTLVRNGAARGVVSLASLASHQPIPDPAIALAPIPAQITAKIISAPTLALRAIEARLALAELKSVMATQPGLMTLADVPILTEGALWAGDGALASSIANLSPAPLDPRLALVLSLYDPARQIGAIDARIGAAGADPVARRVAMRDAVVAWSAGVTGTGSLSVLIQSGLPWGPAGNAGLRAALDFAAGRGAKGEVILLSALALQGVEPAAIDPETLITAVKALRRAGLADSARDLARDYLLATQVILPARQAPRARPAVTPIAGQTGIAKPAASSIGTTVTPAPLATPRLAPRARDVTVSPPPPPPPARGRLKPSWGTP
jgi:hypothetical protein